MFYVVANWLLRGLLRTLTRLSVEGRENLPDAGAAIVVANHTHIVDPPVLACLLPRRVTYMAKQEAFDAPFMGIIVRAYGAFPVRRGQPDRAALRRAEAVVRGGGVLGMFPEGTRSQTGALRAAYPGAALVAVRTRAPVVPVGIDGTDQLFPSLLRARRPRLRVRIGPPFYAGRDDARTDLSTATDDMMRSIATLLPPERRGAYAPVPPMPEATLSSVVGEGLNA